LKGPGLRFVFGQRNDFLVCHLKFSNEKAR